MTSDCISMNAALVVSIHRNGFVDEIEETEHFGVDIWIFLFEKEEIEGRIKMTSISSILVNSLK